mmetsp:Transcript_24495/g.53639  ORF Transcript_24495/g.53639 Transcript_24495/m.53639 type:complete len:211 (+) Transcript_24495:2009-2641(+)
MVRCSENWALMTYIRMGTSTRGPNSMARRDNPSNWRSNARGSVPRRPREEAISWTFLLSRAAVNPSIGMTDLGARMASWSLEETIDSFLRASSRFLASSETLPAPESLSFFFLTTTAFLSHLARPLSSPISPPSSESESESESGASQSTSLSSSPSEPLSEPLSLSEELLEELLLELELELPPSESLSSPPASPRRSTLSSSSSSSGFFR